LAFEIKFLSIFLIKKDKFDRLIFYEQKLNAIPNKGSLYYENPKKPKKIQAEYFARTWTCNECSGSDYL